MFSKKKRRKTHYVPDGGMDLYAPAGMIEWGDMWDHSDDMDSEDVLDYIDAMMPTLDEDSDLSEEEKDQIARQALEKLIGESILNIENS